MELSIIFLPLVASIISGFFGRYIGDRNSEIFTSTLVSISAEIETKVLVNISEFLSPIYLPKKPEMIEATSGRNIIESSMINLSAYLFLQLVLFQSF